MSACEVPLVRPLGVRFDELINTSHGHRPFPHQAFNRTDRAVPSERRSDDSTVETDIEVLTFHAAALSNNPSTTNPHIKQNAQPHGNTTKISHSNHLTNHLSQNNQFSTKATISHNHIPISYQTSSKIGRTKRQPRLTNWSDLSARQTVKHQI